MTETLVHYHVEDEVGRPAINVKDHHNGMDFVFAVERLIGGPAEGLLGESVNCRYSDTLRNIAYDRIVSDFWQAAQEIATQRGLGEIEQQGRSGGWLVFTDGRDPQTDPGCLDHGIECPVPRAHREDWLAAYRSMVEWADTWIADAPRKVAALAQQLAMDEAGEEPARRMFARFADIGAATWAYEGGAPRSVLVSTPSAADWECGSCGALIDPEVGEPGDLYHLPDEDCRSVREIEADDGKVLIAGVLYDAETLQEAEA